MSTSAGNPQPEAPLLYTFDDLKRATAEMQRRGDMIKDMIPNQSVGIIVGDSGLGKSPLLYDMCLRLSAGLPFLDCEVKQAPTLILDYENGEGRIPLCETLMHTAGLQRIPEDFRIDPAPGTELKAKLQYYRPGLVLIDSLRMFNPQALEGSGVEAVRMLKELQSYARAYTSSFVLIHHLRKEDRKHRLPELAETPVLEWLLEAAGSRAFINQSDVRLAIDKDRKAGHGVERLVLKYFVKLRGEFGPFYVDRIFDGAEPIGYRRVSNVSLLSSEYRGLFNRLPNEFRHGEAEKLCGKSGGALAYFLRQCEAAGVLRKQSGTYVKTEG